MTLLCRIFGHTRWQQVTVSFGLLAFRCGRCGEQTFGKGEKR